MKNKVFVGKLILVLALCMAFVLAGCNSKDEMVEPSVADSFVAEEIVSEVENPVETDPEVVPEPVKLVLEEEYEPVIIDYEPDDVPQGPLSKAEEMELLFTLDYNPMNIEPRSEAKKVNLNSKPASDERPSDYIPGLRDLDDYQTLYSDTKISLAEYYERIAEMDVPEAMSVDFQPDLSGFEGSDNDSSSTASKPAATDSKTSTSESKPASTSSSQTTSAPKKLYVSDWGPRAYIPGGYNYPTFYVEFSDSIKNLSALNDKKVEQEEAAKIFSINPPLKGHYQWVGTKNLSFVAEEYAHTGTKYTISVNKDLVSVNGEKISGTLEFSTKGEELQLNWIDYGARPGSKVTVTYDSSVGIDLPTAKFFEISFNAPVSLDEVYQTTVVLLGDYRTGKKLSYIATPDGDSGNGLTKYYYIEVTDPIETKNKITVKTTSLDGERITYKYFNTLIPFEVTSVEKYKSSVTFYFNQSVDKSTVLDGLDVKGFELTQDNFYSWGSYIEIPYIPLKPGETAEISTTDKLKNTRGATLSNSKSVSLEGSDFSGFVKFLDSGSVMLESQFAKKILFEYMNVSENASYLVRKTDSPLDYYSGTSIKNILRNSAVAKSLDYFQRNVHLFQEIDLEPYLENGKGHIQFMANIPYEYYDYRGEKNISDATNYLNIQVTNLAATVRFGINKAVVMVRTLDTDEPVADAEVSFHLGAASYDSQVVKTDSEGFAIIPIDYEKAESMFTNSNVKKNYSSPVFTVKTDDDCILFTLSGHSTWSSNVSSSSVPYGVSDASEVFLFCDRGLYKPGETVSFRGIEKNKSLGRLSSYNGNYTVSLREDSWRSSSFDWLSGTTTESGSFWGSFTLPDDLEPGDYLIEYDGKGKRSISFTVAYFTPLKIQSSLKLDNRTLIAGDKIEGEFEASYLAGGYLAEADYSASLYKKPTYFTPSDKKLSEYTYGLIDSYGYEDYVSGMDGLLDSSGHVSLSFATGKNFKAMPYRYSLEVSATDVSNQRIATSGSVLVHPASYYIGIKRPAALRGFAKSGETLEFPVVLVTPESEILSDLSNVYGSISYQLSRTYWTYDYQSSVDGQIYERWVERTDIEKTGKISVGGITSLTVEPKNSGWYKLKLEGKDKLYRDVITEYEFYVSGSGASWSGGSNSTQLKLTPDQSMYVPGDTAQILLESPLPKGDYLVTVEREGIFTEEVMHFEENCNVFEIPIARNYLPVVYVSVASYSVREGEPVHEYGERDLGKPKAYYGVTSLFVDPRAKAFSIDVETDKEVYKPGDTATVVVKATRGGKPLADAEISVMGVDRAILDLIDYHVSDPISFFYSTGRYPLYVSGGDSRSFLMDPVTYSVANLQGGDAEKDGDERDDFRPTAFFEPALFTGEDGTVSFTFKVPSNLSTFRVTAFGVKNDLFALQEDEFAVQNPVNVQAVQPNKLRVRDTAECGVLITNITDETQNVTVTMEIRDPKGNYSEDAAAGRVTRVGKAFIDGEKSCTVKVTPGRSTVAYFDVAAEDVGNVEFVYTISCGALKEKLVSRMEIEKSYSFETVALMGSLDPVENGKTSATEKVVIPGFMDDGLGNIKVTADGTQLGLLSSSVTYLFDYPYGCMEQRSSKILPLVIFGENIEDLGMNSRVYDAKAVVKAEMADWKNVQHDNGGFPYWPDDKEKENLYVSIRIAHIYAAGLKNGYTAADMSININSLCKYIAKELNSENKMSAYACYIFSLLGRSDLDDLLDEMYALYKTSDLYATVYCGLAYANKTGEKAKTRAEKCASIVKAYMRPNLRSVDMSFYSWGGSAYLSKNGIMAAAMQLLITQNTADPMIDRLLFTILQVQRAGYWSNTATTAQILESINAYMDARNVRKLDMDAVISLDGIDLLNEHFKYPNDLRTKSAEEDFSGDKLNGLKQDVALPLTFSSEGTGTLYYSAQMTYAIPDELQTARDEGFLVEYKLWDYDSGEEIKPKAGTSLIELESGKIYKVQVSLSSYDKDHQYVALRVPVPSGAEILDSQFASNGRAAETTSYGWSVYSNCTILENEVQYFWDNWGWYGGSSVEFTFRAERRGVYPTTPVFAECMYEPEIFGRSDGYLYTIR
ncbi:MAG: MG2 domain-containing protein [Treponemataceae bacterium]|nr:MG2 domain-containing protein [Treponemataceae bacterium]